MSSSKSIPNFPYITYIVLCLSYAVYASIRRIPSITMPWITDTLHINKTDIGLISTAYSTGYGISKFFGSIACDYLSCRMVLSVSICMASAASICFSTLTVPYLMATTWFIQGLAQGIGWPAISFLIYSHFDANMTGTIWSTITSAGNVSYVLAPLLLVPLIGMYGWTAPFVCFGVCGLLMSLVVYIAIPEVSSCGASATMTSNSPDAPFDSKWYISLPVVCLNLCNCLTLMLLGCIVEWAGLYLIEYCNCDRPTAAMILLCAEVGGFVATLLCGVLSDKYFRDRLDLFCLLFSVLMFPALILLPISGYIPPIEGEDIQSRMTPAVLLACGCLFLMGAAINGPKTLIGIAVRQLVPPSSAGLASGVLGIFAQIGGTAAGSGMAYMLQHYKWDCYIPCLFIISTVLSGLLLLSYTVSNSRKKSKVS
mmetsp:Transcript_9965/g.15036  ORF Transcript_9965/g.15036 Transcript_9965/m.15036 type:complete len:425 (+) Transcript_9965:78-1352(+)